MKTAIGILGGTFDPIHYGHLTPAREAMQALGLEHIRLMPNHIPPHRPQPVASSEQRLAMVTLAASEFGGFQVDDRELRRQSPSFTFDTLRQLRHELPDTPICFLIGMDSLLSLPTWHRWQELTDYAHLVVSVRPGWPRNMVTSYRDSSRFTSLPITGKSISNWREVLSCWITPLSPSRPASYAFNWHREWFPVAGYLSR